MLPRNVASLLGPPADQAIATALTNGASIQTGPPGNEVAFVAALVLAGVPDIAAAWQPIMKSRGFRLSITGVFCHAAPQVTFGATSPPSRCELAELLLVIDDVTGGSVQDRRAVLVQAKMLTRSAAPVTLSGGSLVQLNLYSAWPPFAFTSKAYPSRQRDFNRSNMPGTAVDCGSYGLIDGQALPRGWQQAVPAPTMSGQISLGMFMAEMVDATCIGSGRQARPAGNDEWSSTVDDLLNVTARKKLKHSSIAPQPTGAGPDRGVSAFALLSSTHPPASEGYFAEGSPPDGGGGEDGREGRDDDGISTIRMRLSQE